MVGPWYFIHIFLFEFHLRYFSFWLALMGVTFFRILFELRVVNNSCTLRWENDRYVMAYSFSLSSKNGRKRGPLKIERRASIFGIFWKLSEICSLSVKEHTLCLAQMYNCTIQLKASLYKFVLYKCWPEFFGNLRMTPIYGSLRLTRASW